MGRAKNQKLGKRLLAVVISVLATIAVMAVGVYASTANFSLQVRNNINISITKVDGTLYARRGGDVIYGDMSRGDEAKDFDESLKLADTDLYLNSDLSEYKDIDDLDEDGRKDVDDDRKYLVLYDQIDELNEFTMDEIKDPVNFYLTSKDHLTIFYVFKFEFEAGSPQKVFIRLDTTGSDDIPEYLKGEDPKVKIEYKYVQGGSGTLEPTNWASASDMTTDSIQVDPGNTATHVTYIYAAMTVARTNKLGTIGADGNVIPEAFVLGTVVDAFNWKFSLIIDTIGTQV